MKIQLLPQKTLSTLKGQLESNWENYKEISSELFSLNELVNCSFVVDDPPELKPDPDGDAENSEQIYRWLSKLSPMEAADERLWAALTHTTYRDYVTKRWPPTSASQVKSRFFYSGSGLDTAVRNGVSRLWWFGYLTHDEGAPDPFHLTSVLLSNQDIQQNFTERSIGRCRSLLRAALRFFKENTDPIDSLGVSNFANEFAKVIRIKSGVVLFDALDESQIQEIVNTAGNDTVARMAAKKAA